MGRRGRLTTHPSPTAARKPRRDGGDVCGRLCPWFSTSSPVSWPGRRRFTLGVPRAVTISADGGRVLFLRTNGGEDPGQPPVAPRPDRRSEGKGEAASSCCRPDRLLERAGSGEVPEAERIRRERARELAAGIVAYSADEALPHRSRSRSTASSGSCDVPAPGHPPALPRPVPTAGPGDRTAHRPHRPASRVRHRRRAARRRARTTARQPGARRARARRRHLRPRRTRRGRVHVPVPRLLVGTGRPSAAGRPGRQRAGPAVVDRRPRQPAKSRRARSATRPPGPPTPTSPRTCSGSTAPGPSSPGTARRSST